MELFWVGVVLLVVGLAGELLGLFLRFDRQHPKYQTTADDEMSDFGLKLAVVSGVVILVALIVVGYAIRGWFSN